MYIYIYIYAEADGTTGTAILRPRLPGRCPSGRQTAC